MPNTIPEITFRTSPRAKRLRLSVHPDGQVVVSIPKRASIQTAERFVSQHLVWIANQLAKLAKRPPTTRLPHTRKDYLNNYKQAKTTILAQVEAVNQMYQVKYNQISIKNLKSRWGSCSKRGNLNFNYKLIYLPPELVEYVVTHELCHLIQFNHSKRFWNEVARQVPEYKQRRLEMKKYATK